MRDSVWYTSNGDDPIEVEIIRVHIGGTTRMGARDVLPETVFATEAEACEAAARYWDGKELRDRLNADANADRASKLRKGEKRPLPIEVAS